MIIGLIVAVFISVALLSYATLAVVFSDDRRVSRRLEDLTTYERAQAREAQPLLQPFTHRILAPIGRAMGRVGHALWPAGYTSRIEEQLTRAGRPSGMTISRFTASKLIGAVGLFLLLIVVGIVAEWSFLAIVFWSVAAGVFGLYAPDMWLMSAVSSRRRQIVRELPDMLDMLTISVQAGLGFDAALSKLVRNSTGPLAEEFGRTLQEVQAGGSRKEALRHMAERVDVPELSSFTAAIIQAEMFGISVAQVLRTQAVEMRVRRRQRAEEEAQKAPVKMVIPLVLCILPATFIVVVGPAAIRIAHVFMGR